MIDLQSAEVIVTNDGSHTIAVPSLGITYHSTHGAVQESVHVFIDACLKFAWGIEHDKNLVTKVFELGFGTGLNALLTCQESLKEKRKVFYTTIEAYPLPQTITTTLNYNDPEAYLQKIHEAQWNKPTVIHEYFSLEKIPVEFEQATGSFDLVYFDAFSPGTQPELWTVESFSRIAGMMNPGAALTTYCSKSEVRRNMVAAGLKVEKIPGPWGKREMVRAHKL